MDHNSIKSSKPGLGLFHDILHFMLKRPLANTLIEFNTPQERLAYSKRILQRIGMDTDQFSVLNVHKIAIDAPVHYIFDELLNWSGDSVFWPNHLAKADRIENELANIRILPFGRKKYPLPFMKSIFGIKIIPLFELTAIKIQRVPEDGNNDNARYLLYECSGGYPIGIFAMYVRSSIAAMGETGKSQLFVGVGFNFYGKQDWQKKRKWINTLWEWVHNRVTSHVLVRLKMLSENKVAQLQKEAMSIIDH